MPRFENLAQWLEKGSMMHENNNGNNNNFFNSEGHTNKKNSANIKCEFVYIQMWESTSFS